MFRRLWPCPVIWLLVLTMPVVLLVADLHLVNGRWFLHWEYGKADFPPDPYGLSTVERLRLAEICVEYLETNSSIALLRELRLPDGDPAFNARELRHMADVQVVYNRMTMLAIVIALLQLGGIVMFYVSDGTRHHAPAVLLNGGVFTLGMLGAVGVFMLLSWGDFFTTFHRLFFEGETWIFPHSDTLIRLFPVRFWMDVAALVVGLLAVEAAVVSFVGWMWRRRISSDA